MGKLRFLIAVIVGKISAFLLDKIFKRGTNTPGIIILLPWQRRSLPRAFPVISWINSAWRPCSRMLRSLPDWHSSPCSLSGTETQNRKQNTGWTLWKIWIPTDGQQNNDKTQDRFWMCPAFFLFQSFVQRIRDDVHVLDTLMSKHHLIVLFDGVRGGSVRIFHIKVCRQTVMDQSQIRPENIVIKRTQHFR